MRDNQDRSIISMQSGNAFGTEMAYHTGCNIANIGSASREGLILQRLKLPRLLFCNLLQRRGGSEMLRSNKMLAFG